MIPTLLLLTSAYMTYRVMHMAWPDILKVEIFYPSALVFILILGFLNYLKVKHHHRRLHIRRLQMNDCQCCAWHTLISINNTVSGNHFAESSISGTIWSGRKVPTIVNIEITNTNVNSETPNCDGHSCIVSRRRLQPSGSASNQKRTVVEKCITILDNVESQDEFDIFGKYVANELRLLKDNPDLKIKLKHSIQQNILQISSELLARHLPPLNVPSSTS